MYKNSFDCFFKVIKNEGVFGLYRGMLSTMSSIPILNLTVHTSIIMILRLSVCDYVYVSKIW